MLVATGGAGVAAGRLLGAGAPTVRHRQRPVMTQPPAVPPAGPASPGGALPETVPSEAVPSEAVPSEAVPSETVLFGIVSGEATAEEIAALTAVLAPMAAASRRNAFLPERRPTATSSWAERSRLVRPAPRPRPSLAIQRSPSLAPILAVRPGATGATGRSMRRQRRAARPAVRRPRGHSTER